MPRNPSPPPLSPKAGFQADGRQGGCRRGKGPPGEAGVRQGGPARGGGGPHRVSPARLGGLPPQDALHVAPRRLPPHFRLRRGARGWRHGAPPLARGMPGPAGSPSRPRSAPPGRFLAAAASLFMQGPAKDKREVPVSPGSGCCGRGPGQGLVTHSFGQPWSPRKGCPFASCPRPTGTLSVGRVVPANHSGNTSQRAPG